MITLATVALISTTFVSQASAYTYTVKKGDSLYQIAQKHSISINKLKKLNRLSSDFIQIHQKLKDTKDGTESKPTSSIKDKHTYLAIKGDTLSKIALQHNIRLKELMKSLR